MPKCLSLRLFSVRLKVADGQAAYSGPQFISIKNLLLGRLLQPSGILWFVIDSGKRPSSILYVVHHFATRGRLWFVIDSGKLKTSSKIAQLFKTTESGTLQRAPKVLKGALSF